MSTQTLEQTSSTTEKQELHHLILFNDDVNTFEHVIEMLVEHCNHDFIQAEQCAMLVHFKGKCSVKKGAYKELALTSEVLAENGLSVEIN